MFGFLSQQTRAKTELRPHYPSISIFSKPIGLAFKAEAHQIAIYTVQRILNVSCASTIIFTFLFEIFFHVEKDFSNIYIGANIN